MKIKYLTWLNEKTGKSEEYIDLPANVKNIEELISFLKQSRPEYNELFRNRHVIYTAVNDEMCSGAYEIKNSDEVSFFSAMVGG